MVVRYETNREYDIVKELREETRTPRITNYVNSRRINYGHAMRKE